MRVLSCAGGGDYVCESGLYTGPEVLPVVGRVSTVTDSLSKKGPVARESQNCPMGVGGWDPALRRIRSGFRMKCATADRMLSTLGLPPARRFLRNPFSI